VRIANTENDLTRFFLNSENWGDIENKKNKMKSRQFLEPAPKIKINDFHKKLKITQHYS
jgi:hypothetical protein